MAKDINEKLELAERRAERYKQGRDAAERLLEHKSRELFLVNGKLQASKEGLLNKVNHATNKLSISNQRLKKALETKSNFLGQVSHEVRTPLNAIIGLSEILLETKLDDAQLDYMNTIHSGANSMMILIDDLLDITKIEAGRLDIKAEKNEVEVLLKNILGMFKLVAKNQGLKLDLIIDKSVPHTVSIDNGRYAQIVNNLISNAIKNTPSGRVFLEVSFRKSVEPHKSGALVTKVVDTGIGIEESQIERIFDAYEQVGRPTQGIGLGLSICKQLAELMGGSIHCESKLNSGTIFEVELPVEVSAYRQLDKDTPVAPQFSALPPLKILVAEDNPTNQKVLTAQLAQLGQSAQIVGNGAEALELLSDQQFDVIFLDIQMPILGGEETLLAIRNSQNIVNSQYCIALTASAHSNQREHFIELGFDAFLSKPLGLYELSKALESVPESFSMVTSAEVSFTEWESVADVFQEEGAKFDFSYLKSQFGESYSAIFKEIAPTFIIHAYKDLEALIVHSDDGSADQIRRVSHSMKGAASSIGLTDLANILLKIETEAESTDVSRLVLEVESYMYRIKPIIELELVKLETHESF
jgi:signal transduction histidine kinase/AmiR/NasT family two-component response regulator/HPt (histidine-containing phosphotransfer) domain-containing protein